MIATKLAQNVKARKAANTVVELGVTVGKDEGFEPEQVRRMWQYVMEIAAELIGDRLVEPEPQPVSVSQAWSTVGSDSLDDEEFPFGKHVGERFADVPDGYFRWLAKQGWIEKWPEVLEYIQEHDLD